ncbi:hypothetical protein HDV05_003558 [Chytridiales sp. JEL 0842]|nr:hypothetical protein HDV05_003558 [Chytridiales sp. JEL 0842]
MVGDKASTSTSGKRAHPPSSDSSDFEPIITAATRSLRPRASPSDLATVPKKSTKKPAAKRQAVVGDIKPAQQQSVESDDDFEAPPTRSQAEKGKGKATTIVEEDEESSLTSLSELESAFEEEGVDQKGKKKSAPQQQRKAPKTAARSTATNKTARQQKLREQIEPASSSTGFSIEFSDLEDDLALLPAPPKTTTSTATQAIGSKKSTPPSSKSNLATKQASDSISKRPRRSLAKSSAAADHSLIFDDEEEEEDDNESAYSASEASEEDDELESGNEFGTMGTALALEDDEAEEDDGGEEEAPASSSTQRRRSNGVAAAVRNSRRRSSSKKLTQEERIFKQHPELETVWTELESIPKREIPPVVEQPENVKVKLLPFQREGVHWLREQEESRFNGGILADEMGMGKTIQMISLLVTKPDVKPNLILTPTVAILQWLSELRERVTADFFKICVYHGSNRETSAEKLAEYDVVLSTYSVIETAFRREHYGFKHKGVQKKEKSVIHSIKWGRVILDEAHAIKDRSCQTARAVFGLDCRYKWSLSGTPLQNRVGELYSLIRFLNADPFSFYFCKQCPCKIQTWSFSDRRHCDSCGHISHQHFCWWNSEILKPIQRFGGSEDGLVAFKKLGLLLDHIMLRRTKVERADDLGLPPRVIVVRRDVFNEAEEELYESLYSDSKRTFSTYVNSNTVLNNYASIFSLLSRMRLAVNHPDLVTTRLAINANQATETMVCGICQEPAEDPILSKCKHIFCREDIREYIISAPDGESCTCPVCFVKLSIDLTQQQYEPKKGGGGDGAKTSIVNYIDMSRWRSSTKIEALVEELTALQRDDSTMKSIVFSQFVAFLDLIHWRLSRAGFTCVKLDGRMSPQARDAVIKSFMTDPQVTIFLVSLKAGGVALNLTEASRVFILDPWWNPAVEDQAFDRIHRLGQTRPIKITRLIIENSIESRILQLQEKKKMLFQSTVGKDVDALAKGKREADTYLTQDNHDRDEDDEVEPTGEFKRAPEEVLKRRPIAAPKLRGMRSAVASTPAAPKPAFAGFSFGGTPAATPSATPVPPPVATSTPSMPSSNGISTPTMSFTGFGTTSTAATPQLNVEAPSFKPVAAASSTPAFSFGGQSTSFSFGKPATPATTTTTTASNVDKSASSEIKAPIFTAPAVSAPAAASTFKFGSTAAPTTTSAAIASKDSEKDDATALLRNLRGLNTSFSSHIAAALLKDPFGPFTGAFDEYFGHLSKIVKDNAKVIGSLEKLDQSDPLKVLASALSPFVEGTASSKAGEPVPEKTAPSDATTSKPPGSPSKPAPAKPTFSFNPIPPTTSNPSTNTTETLYKPAPVASAATPAEKPTFSFSGFSAPKPADTPVAPATFSFSNLNSASKPSTELPTVPTATSKPLFGSGTPFSFGSLSSAPAPAPVAAPKLADNEGGDGEGDDDDIVHEEQIDTAKLMRGEGEEGEETLMEVRTKAFTFDTSDADKKNWKWTDFGVGLIKINKDKDSEKARLLLRADGSGRVRLNCYIFDGMKAELQGPKAIGLMAMIENKLTKLLLRMKEPSDTSKFLELLKKETLNKLRDSGKTSGVIVIQEHPDYPRPPSFSPDSKSPNFEFSLYANQSGKPYEWNPASPVPVWTLPKDIIFTSFAAEPFGFSGSQRFVQDLTTDFQCKQRIADRTQICRITNAACSNPCFETTNFTSIDFNRIDAVVEFNQVGGIGLDDLASPNIFMHVDDAQDPATRTLVERFRGSATVLGVNSTANMTVNVVPAFSDTVNNRLPPSSAMAFLAKKKIPAIVFGDYRDAYTNNSEYDDGSRWNERHATLLCGLATSSARSLFIEAGGNATVASTLNSNCTLVGELFNCFTRNMSCPTFKLYFNDTGSAYTSYPTVFNFGTISYNPYYVINLLSRYVSVNTTGTCSGNNDTLCSAAFGYGPGFQCAGDVCVKSLTALHPAYGTGIEIDYDNSAFFVKDPTKAFRKCSPNENI